MTENVQESKLRKLHTKHNTTLEEWCKLAIAEIKRRKIDGSKVTKLAAKHAWEYESTPESFALQIQHMNERKIRSTETKPNTNI